MKVALVGGSGFIGSRLAEILLHEHEVLIFDLRINPQFAGKTVQGDVRDLSSLRDRLRGCEAIVLLAAEHKDNVQPPELYYDVNVGGAYNVAQAATALGIKKILFTSSVAVYGPSNSESSEETLPAPSTHYGKSKLQAEDVLRDWAGADPERLLTIVRPTVVFGPGNRGNVYNLFRQIASGRFIMIGDGGNRKSMAFVENVAAFLHHCLNMKDSGVRVFNYSDKPDYRMHELVGEVRGILGLGAPGLRIPLWLALWAASAFYFCAHLLGKESCITPARIRKFAANTRFSSDLAFLNGFKALFDLQHGIRITLQSEFFEAGDD